MNKKYIIITSLIACVLLYFVEQILMVNYVIKTAVKILLFILIPCIYFSFIKKSKIKRVMNLRKLHIKHLKLGILFGMLSFVVIIITYRIIGSYIDLQGIAQELQSKSKITTTNFIFVALYITLGNSFLEEFFFRGYIFLNLYDLGFKRMAYFYSSLLFGIYHIAIFKTWFSSWQVSLALLGLISIGFVFNWLDLKSKNFINSWIVHIFADIAIIVIGLKMFMII